LYSGDRSVVKACPWCGRNNLDSDEYCFNCERDLNAVPDEEDARELEREIRRIRVQKPSSIVRLVLMSILRKVVLSMFALGAFFIMVLLAIWISYDNTTVFLVLLGILGAAVLLAFYYPDIRLSRKIGTRGALVSIIANVILLVLLMPPVLWFLDRRGYISSAWDFLAKTWWAYPAFLLLGILLSWLAGRRAALEAPNP
jgi:hypothetical protein